MIASPTASCSFIARLCIKLCFGSRADGREERAPPLRHRVALLLVCASFFASVRVLIGGRSEPLPYGKESASRPTNPNLHLLFYIPFWQNKNGGAVKKVSPKRKTRFIGDGEPCFLCEYRKNQKKKKFKAQQQNHLCF